MDGVKVPLGNRGTHGSSSVHEDPWKRMHMQILKDGDPRMRISADANICNIIIIYHDFLPTPRRGSHSHV